MGERARDQDGSRGRVRRAESGGRSGESLSVLEELADFCMAAGEYSTAVEYYQQVLDLLTQRVEGNQEASLLRRMAGCFRNMGDFDRALDLLSRAETMADEDPVEVARILNERAWAFLRKGDYEESAKQCSQVLDLMGDASRERECAAAYNCLGSIALRKGEAEKAREFYEGALALYRRLGDRDGVGRCCNNLGLVAKDRGDWESAVQYMNLALEMARDVGNSLSIGIRLNNVGITYFKKGEPEKARECWEEALSIFQRTGEKWEVASPSANLGNYYRLRRDWQKAAEYYVRARATSERNGDRRGVALALEFQGCLLMDQGNLESAGQCFQEGLRIAEDIAPKGDLVGEVLRNLGELRLMQGDVEAASSCCLRALPTAVASGNRYEEACVLRVLGMVAAAREQWEESEQHFERSLRTLATIGGRYEFARTCVDAARCLSGVDLRTLAVKPLLLQAKAVFEGMDARHELGRGLVELAAVEVRAQDTLQAQEHVRGAEALLPAEDREGSALRLARVSERVDKTLATESASPSNDLAEFNRLVGRVAALDGLEAKMKEALEILVGCTGGERGMLVVHRPDAGIGDLEVSCHLDAEGDRWVPRFVKGLASNGHDPDEPIVSNHPEQDSRLSLPRGSGRRVSSLLFVPLVQDKKVLGGVYVDQTSPEKRFGRKEVDFAVAFAGAVASFITRAEAREMRRENEGLREQLGDRGRFSHIVTQNPAMLEVIASIRKLDRGSTTVLIQGETGTGKELVAQAIHAGGSQREGPLVTINCAALSEHVLEAELFGHVKGAFTDAKSDREGLFARAAGGTVFLDEIDKTSRNFQEKLLRVVDTREFTPVGSSTARQADFRIVCATNKDLAAEVEEGRFLPDLYYRLTVIRLKVPPLRERREDIPLLTTFFLERYCRRFGKEVKGLAPEAMELLVSYRWPGNVRQLQHEVERVVAFATEGDRIGPEDLSEELRNWGALIRVTETKALAEAVEQVERRMIGEALGRHAGNRTKAASSLGLSRRGLLNKIKRYRLES